MPSSGVSETIFLTTSILIALGFVGILSVVIQDQGNDAGARTEQASRALRSDITLLNDVQQLQTDPLVLYVRNTGETELASQDVLVFLDGQIAQDVDADVLGSDQDDVWRPDQILQLTVNDLAVASGPHQVRVVAATGTQAAMAFTA